jgi:hypothetical protein
MAGSLIGRRRRNTGRRRPQRARERPLTLRGAVASFIAPRCRVGARIGPQRGANAGAPAINHGEPMARRRAAASRASAAV